MADQSTDQPQTEPEAGQGLIEDHIALIYESNEERLATITPLIKVGLEKGELCLYISDEEDDQGVVEALKAQHIDVEKAISNGGLILTNKKEMYFKLGRFDPEWTLRVIHNIADLARSYGFTAMRIMSDMKWTLEKVAGVERWPEYEAKMNTLNPGISLRIICQYDRTAFAPEALMAAVQTHPKIVTQGSVNKNLFHIPSDQILRGNYAELELERVMGSIRQLNAAESELQDREDTISAMKRQVEADSMVKKNLENALDESRRRFRDLAERASDWAWELDENGAYIYSSPRVKDILGLRPEDIIGKAPVDFVTKEEAERVSRLLARAVGSRAPISALEKEVRHKDGHAVFLEMSGTPYFDHEGKFLGYRGVDRDITGRRAAKQAIEESRKRTEESLAEIDRRDGRIASLEEEISQLKTSLAEMDTAIASIKTDLDGKLGELAVASAAMVKLQEGLSKRDEELTTATSTLEERTAQAEASARELEQLRSEVAAKGAELDALKASLVATEAVVLGKCSELDSLTSTFNSQSMELKGTKESLAGVEESLAHKEEELVALRQHTERLEADLKVTHEALAARSEELSQTQASVAAVTMALEVRSGLLASATGDLEATREQLAAVQAERSRLAAELNAKEAALGDTIMSYEGTKADLAVLTEEFQRLTEAKIALDAERDRLNLATSAQADEIAQLKERLEQITTDLARTTEQLASVTSTGEERQRELSMATARVDMLAKAMVLKEEDLSASLKEAQELRSGLALYQGRSSQLESDLNVAATVNLGLREAMEIRQKDIAEMLAELTATQAKAAALTEEKDGLASQLDRVDGRLFATESALAQKEQELASSAAELTARENQLANVKAELEARTAELAVTVAVLEGKNVDLDLAKSRINELGRDLAYTSRHLEDREALLAVTEAKLSESEERFRSLYEQSGLGIVRVSPEGDLLEANGKFHEMLGYDPGELSERQYVDLIHSDDAQELDVLHRRLLSGEPSTGSALKRLSRKSGSTLWANITMSAIRDEHDNVRYIMAVVDDRTDQILNEQSMREKEYLEREERLRASWENSPDGVWVLDPEGRTTYINTSMAAMLGYTREEMTGRMISGFMNHEWRNRSREEPGREVLLVRKDGGDLWATISSLPILDQAGHVTGAVGLVNDITSLKEKARDLEMAQYAASADAARLHTIIMGLPVPMAMVTSDGRVALTNPALERMMNGADLTGQNVHEVWPGIDMGEKGRVKVVRDGKEVEMLILPSPLREGVHHTGTVMAFVDALPERDADAPSPETLAHDLNDSLQVIMGSVSLAKEYVIPEGRMYSKLRQIESASVTARDLAGQLMISAREGHPLTGADGSPTELVKGKGRLLLMDDDENVLEATGDLLRYLGYDIEVARDGEEALTLSREAEEAYRPFDLAILDLSIAAGMGGLEAGKKLKEADPQLLLIVTSGYVSDPAIADHHAFGFSAALPKPYSAELLSQTVAGVLAKRSEGGKHL